MTTYLAGSTCMKLEKAFDASTRASETFVKLLVWSRSGVAELWTVEALNEIVLFGTGVHYEQICRFSVDYFLHAYFCQMLCKDVQNNQLLEHPS